MEELIASSQAAVDTLSNAMQTNQGASSSGIYAVMWVTLIVWCGIFFYLFYLDRQIKKVKNKINIKEKF